MIARIESLQYASAGHESAWLLSRDGVLRELPSTGLLLGVEEDSIWDNAELQIVPGERLLMLTDGVTETFDSQDEFSGRKQLIDAFVECHGLKLADTINRLNQELIEFRGGVRQHDDVTVLTVEFEHRNSLG